MSVAGMPVKKAEVPLQKRGREESQGRPCVQGLHGRWQRVTACVGVGEVAAI